MRILRDSSDNGINFSDSMSPCDVCAFGKSEQERHPTTTTNNNIRPFQLAYTDLLGPVSPPALGGFRYVSKYTDQHSKWKGVFLIKEKTDAVNTLKIFVQTVGIPRGLDIERLRTVRGGEYTAGYFERYCLEKGMKRGVGTRRKNHYQHRALLAEICRFSQNLHGENVLHRHLPGQPHAALGTIYASSVHGTLRCTRQTGPPSSDRRQSLCAR